MATSTTTRTPSFLRLTSAATLATIFPKNSIVEDTYTISTNDVNQFKMSYTRYFQDIVDLLAGRYRR